MRALSPAACGGYMLLALVLWIAWDGSPWLVDSLRVGAVTSVCIALLSTLATAYSYPSALANSKSANLQESAPLQQYALWLLSCVALCVLSFYFFEGLERNTQLNPRLYAIDSGTILTFLKQHALVLGLVPWVLYVLLGLGLAYSTVVFKKRPLLSELCLLSITHKSSKAVIHSLLSIPIDLVKIGWVVLTASFMALWIADALCDLFHLESLFVRPLRLIFMGGLVVFVLRNPAQKLILWMEQSKASLATVLGLYLGLFILFLMWLHGTSDIILLHVTTHPDAFIKRTLAGHLSKITLDSHLYLLILGWWTLWLPWMVSMAARAALGSSMVGALLKLSVLPVCLFVYVLPAISTQHYDALQHFLLRPGIQACACLMLCLWLQSIWGKVFTMGDLQRGAMLTPRRLSQRSLNRWMTVVFVWFSCYFLGYFMVGWRLAQFMLSAAACVMVTLALIFSMAWASSLMPFGALKKCRFLESL